MNESFKVAFEIGGPTKNMILEMRKCGLKYPVFEKLGILAHYAWIAFVVTKGGRYSIPYALSLFLTVTTTCGFSLALVFSLGHNAMALRDRAAAMDFCSLQVSTCRHVNTGAGLGKLWWDWFNGAFQNHIDHHLFPTMPRPNLRFAHPMIKSFCQEFDLEYHETDMVNGIVEVLRYLHRVSREFVLEFVVHGPGMM